MSVDERASAKRDLVTLVADKDMEQTVRGLLARWRAIGFRPLDAEVFVHPMRDGGCRAAAHEFLRPLSQQYAFALVMFDLEGSGARPAEERELLERRLEEGLHANGWTNRSACVVLDPELEVWVWTDSEVLDQVTGWAGENPSLRDWIRANGFSVSPEGKPARPKDAFSAALRHVRKRPSSALFRQLAERVSVERCSDPAFVKLKSLLRGWFPSMGATGDGGKPSSRP
jgi:hypothetical protein